MTTTSVAPSHGAKASHGQMSSLALAALGVVFGDIGTSPLYAVRECLHSQHGVALNQESILGVLSLIFWALTLSISIKYVGYILRADNQGEGGILALTALATSAPGLHRDAYRVALMLGLFGASLLFGDGIITPAISVLSAVEGLTVATPALKVAVLPISSVILVGLFMVQKRGTGSVGMVFGPVMFVWFSTLAVLGTTRILQQPHVLEALNPVHAALFLSQGGHTAFLVLGSVFLVVTGGEALYADVGHFGARPIRIAWFGLVLPALLVNYFGQGALLLQHPEALENPFFLMGPSWALYPLVGLSTMATVIASQALISGAFSLTRQALMLGYLPRLRVEHTSAWHIGQIYVPTINWMLMIAAVALVWAFKTSSNLAAAYGVAVSLDMSITTLLAYVVARYRWNWRVAPAVAVTLLFFMPEMAFLGSNLTKVLEGGWFPLAVGAALFTVYTTWSRGRALLAQRFRERLVPLDDFFELMRIEIPARVPGTAVFMTGNAEGTPPALLQNFLHNRVVHEHVVLFTIVVEKVARVADADRVQVEELQNGFRRAVAHYGFMETPDIPKLLDLPALKQYSIEYVTFFLGRETVIATDRPGMALWRERLFAFLARNAQTATAFFGIPPSRVVEIGAQIEL